MTGSQSTTQTTGLTTWQIDPAHSEIGFAVKHLMISKVHGRFTDLNGELRLDEDDFTNSEIEVEIDAASIDTQEKDRDTHLRSPDFLDVERYPTLAFRSRRVEIVGDGRYRVVGDLTIRDVTREVTLDVSEEGRAADPWGGQRIAFSATARIDRRDFGLTWNQALETGGVLVGNEVSITLEIQAVQVD